MTIKLINQSKLTVQELLDQCEVAQTTYDNLDELLQYSTRCSGTFFLECCAYKQEDEGEDVIKLVNNLYGDKDISYKSMVRDFVGGKHLLQAVKKSLKQTRDTEGKHTSATIIQKTQLQVFTTQVQKLTEKHCSYV